MVSRTHRISPPPRPLSDVARSVDITQEMMISHWTIPHLRPQARMCPRSCRAAVLGVMTWRIDNVERLHALPGLYTNRELERSRSQAWLAASPYIRPLSQEDPPFANHLQFQP